jgi:glycosyltransferase involved in cell wall biosynthesis
LVSLINAKTGNVTHSVYAMDGCYDALELIDGVGTPADMPPAFAEKTPLKAIKACRALLKDYAPDLLVTYNWGSVEWVLANRFNPLCPMIHVQDGFGTEEQNGQKWTRRLARSFAYLGCQAVVVPSLSLEKLARREWYIPQRKLHYIPNGIKIDRFICPPDRKLMQQFDLGKEDRIIGTVAGLRPEKNLGRLIEAFSQISDTFTNTKLVIVGGGMGRAALQMLTDRIGLSGKVVFTGPLQAPEHLVAAFEVFALSSDTEQMPLSVIEAMAAGLPVVSTDVGDIAHMVAPSNREFIKGRSARELTHTLSAMLDRPAQGKRIGAANQEKAKSDYELKTMVARYETLFRDVVDRFRN